jgi:Na+:H+ antiporter, NhaA family
MAPEPLHAAVVPSAEDDSGSRLRPPWSRSPRTAARRIARPLQSFLDAEASSGVLLLVAAAVALAWANSPWSSSYERLWSTVVTVRVGGWSISEDLRHWVNEGLMALFFLVVGLEIKRELLTGELRDRRRAAVPAIAAVGGMLVPAAIYLAFNAGGVGASGWGIPMATDIAFALGVLTIAASHSPATVKPFLLTLAIVDDIGALVVIALFYSTGIAVGGLVAAVTLVGVILLLQRLDVRATIVYVALGVAVWIACFESHVQPAIAGVVLGLATPAVPFQRPKAVSREAIRTAEETVDDPEPPDADAPQWLRLSWLSREAVSPLARIEHLLHPWTSNVIVPLFALANAGVVLTSSALRDAVTSPITLGIVCGLVIGKPLGIAAASALAVRVGRGQLPNGMRWPHLLGTGVVAGIGFTVSLFVADLAFSTERLVSEAKIGILVASVLAGALAYAAFRLWGREASP